MEEGRGEMEGSTAGEGRENVRTLTGDCEDLLFFFTTTMTTNLFCGLPQACNRGWGIVFMEGGTAEGLCTSDFACVAASYPFQS